MRVGIWCDYGVTIGPSEGIGVFVDNLARGLVCARPEVRVLLVAHPGQESVLDSVMSLGLGRIEVTSHVPISASDKNKIRHLKKIRRLLELMGSWTSKWRSSISARIEKLEREHSESCHRIISQADVWLIPYVGLQQDFHKPHVVVVHDLVSYHFPDMLSKRQMRKLKRLVDRRVAKATMIACMSEFIRESDLKGILKLPDSRIRVISAAVPNDPVSSSLSPIEPSDSKKSSFSKDLVPSEPYLFFPAAFRKYKNHQLLVELIPRLKELNLDSMKIVFTGIRKCPRWLRAAIASHDAQDSVLILGKVTRCELAALYRSAFATVVPSFYEQGSFPLLEALQHQCPAISSDIPALREQFAEMGEDMVFFDPHRAESLFSAVRRVHFDRQAIIVAQQNSFARLKLRKWTDAAQDWLNVFSEVIHIEQEASQGLYNSNAA